MREAVHGTDVMRVEEREGIAVLTFNRPEKRNAMSDALVDALDRFFRRRLPISRLWC
ncbi:hypothetical protein V6L77_14545 [Pannonibacter sp. Pt2-lr]